MIRRALTIGALLLATFVPSGSGWAATSTSPAAAGSGAPADRGHLLLFNFTRGFNHLSIPHATEVLRTHLTRAGYEVTVSSDPADLTGARLANTDAVIWLSTTGNGEAPFSADQRHDFESWMGCGGGNIGIHAVLGPMFTGWEAWSQIWGATEGGEPLTETSVLDDQTPDQEGWGQFNATVKVSDHSSPATWPWHRVTSFQARDEYYHWAGDPSKVVPSFHQLLGFAGFTDPRTALQASPAYPYDMPISWTGTYVGTSRNFYTNLGHSTTMWNVPAFVAHVLGGIAYVTGVRPDADCLASHGMIRQVPEPTAGPEPTPTPVAPPTPTPASGPLSCGLVGQGSYDDPARGTDPTASWKWALYGGLGDCNGQPDTACSFQSSMCNDPFNATAAVEAGHYYVDPETDLRYQEPPLEGTGSCAQGNTTGVAFLTWPDHGVTVLSFATTGGELTGRVLDQVSLAPLPGQRDGGGEPVSDPLEVKTTKYSGGTLTGSLTLADCDAGGGPNLFIASAEGDQVTGTLALAPAAG